jgi:PAS domain S-box-containing protein
MPAVTLGRAAALAVAYFFTGKVSILLAIPPGIATPVWVPGGVALAAVLRWGYPVAAGVWVGSFLVNIGVLLDGGGPPGVSAVATASVIATGSTLQALVGAYLIRRFVGGPEPFGSVRIRFCSSVRRCWLSDRTQPGHGKLYLEVSSVMPLPLTWLTWWLGDLVDLVVTLIFLISWRMRRDRLVEAVGVWLVLLAFGILLFRGALLPTVVVRPPMFYVLILLIIWAAFRLGPPGVVATSILVSAVAILRTVVGQGGFALAGTNASLLQLQAFIGLSTLTGLLMAAALTERRRAEQALRQAHDELESRVLQRTVELTRSNNALQAEITERQRTEQALQDSEGLQRGLFEFAPDAILVADETGRMVQVNTQAETLFGYGREELLGRPIEVLLPDRFAARHAQYRKTYIAMPEVRSMGAGLELYGRRRDGSEFPLDIMLSPVEGRHGRMVIAVVRDITERRRSEEVLRHSRDVLTELNQRLQELDRLKSKFISDVSHELRTPVTNLGLYLDLIETGQPAKRKQYETALREQIERLTDLIEKISSLSSMEQDQVTAEFGNVDLNAVVDLVVSEFQPRARSAGLALSFSPGVDPLIVSGVASQLRQVVTNLVANAVSYTPQGRVWVSTGRNADLVYLQVTDTGPGIEAADLQHVFERFYRGRGVSHIPGSGLGLAVVHRIVHLHSGTVEIKTQAGEGSTFTVRLPVSHSR